MKNTHYSTEVDRLESSFGCKDGLAKTSHKVDQIGSLLVVVTLLAGIVLVSITASALIPASAYFNLMFSEVGEAATPSLTKVCVFLQQYHLLELIGLLIAIYGCSLLRTIPDRRRANLYAGIVSLTLLAYGILVLFSSLILLIKIFSVIGFYGD